MEAPLTNPPPMGMINAEELLETLWPSKKSRPCLRWLRNMQTEHMIPFIKMRGKVWFIAQEVSDAIRERHTIRKRR